VDPVGTGLIEKAADLWGKAGQGSLDRSALLEPVEQLTRALAQIASLPPTPAFRREQIKLQVALIAPLTHVKGYAAPETKAAAEQARRLIEQAEALGEPPEDTLLLFSVLYSFWVTNILAFNGGVCRELAAQFLALAEQQEAKFPLTIGHRIVGTSLLYTGEIAEALAHFDRTIALYDAVDHRQLATRFGHDARAAALWFRSWARWLLGYSEAALGQAATLMFSLTCTNVTNILCGKYTAATAYANELVALAEEKGAALWAGFRSSPSWLRICSQWRTHRGHSHYLLRVRRVAINGRKLPPTLILIRFGVGLC
jgi:tetratricopeptide (TPR) repeat protein